MVVDAGLAPDQSGWRPYPDTNDEIVRYFSAKLQRPATVATTVMHSCQILEWVPIESQLPSSIAAKPPAPDELELGERDIETGASVELGDDHAERGPAGSVLIREGSRPCPIRTPRPVIWQSVTLIGRRSTETIDQTGMGSFIRRLRDGSS
jgi:hypothetical protein